MSQKLLLNELMYLESYFKKNVAPYNNIKLDNLDAVFPQVQFASQILKKAFFYAIDLDTNESIYFFEFKQAMKVILKGNKTDKAKFTFQILQYFHYHHQQNTLKIRTHGMKSIKDVQIAFELLQKEILDWSKQLHILNSTQDMIANVQHLITKSITMNEEDRVINTFEHQDTREINKDELTLSHSIVPIEMNEEKEEDDQYFYIRSMYNGLYLDVKGEKSKVNQPIISWKFHGKANQCWKWGTSAFGKPCIISKLNPNLAIGVTKGLFSNLWLVLKPLDHPSVHFEREGLNLVSKSQNYKDQVMHIGGAKVFSKGDSLLLHTRDGSISELTPYSADNLKFNQLFEIIPSRESNDFVKNAAIDYFSKFKLNPFSKFRIKSLLHSNIVIVPKNDVLVTTKSDPHPDQLFYFSSGYLVHINTEKFVGFKNEKKKKRLILTTDVSKAVEICYLASILEAQINPIKYFDIEGANKNPGSAIITWPPNFQANQRWILEPHEEPSYLSKHDPEFSSFLRLLFNNDSFSSCLGLLDYIYEEFESLAH